MKIAIDAVGIRGHGGAAVLFELLRWLPVARPEWYWHVFLFERNLREFDDPIVSEQVVLEPIKMGNGGLGRLSWVNRHLAARLQTLQADLLFSFANIAPVRPVLPQVVFCQQPNALFADGLAFAPSLRRARMHIMRHLIFRGARASRAMIVQTATMRERMLELEPSLRGRIHVIPSGYRTPSENPHARSEKRSLIDRAERPRLIYVSHPTDHKNHLTLLRAMPLILEAFPSASLLLTLERHRSFFPPSYREHIPLIESIQREAELLSVSQRLVWLGILNQDEVEYALRSSDLMVFPSLTESFGLGLVEAMSAGCPVAVADRPYAHDVCGDAAIYFDPNDSESIAEMVTSVCRSRETLERLRSIGTEHKNRFSYQRIAEETARVFELAAQTNMAGR